MDEEVVATPGLSEGCEDLGQDARKGSDPRPWLVLGCSSLECSGLPLGASARGYQSTVVEGMVELLAVVQMRQPAVVVAAIDARVAEPHGLVAQLRERSPRSRLVAHSHQPSVALIVSAFRAGFDDYVDVPCDLERILDAARVRGRAFPVALPERGPNVMSLARARWEVLNRAVLRSGSLSKASSALGLQCRSLRRMLAKAPPSR